MILQHLYCLVIRYAARKEVNNCDICQRKKRSNAKYFKLPTKEAAEIPWNKLCVDLIFPYVIIRKGQRENLNLKSVTMIDPVTGWFKITQYDDKCVGQYPTIKLGTRKVGSKGIIHGIDGTRTEMRTR